MAPTHKKIPNPKTILFVDDDPVVSNVTIMILKKLGYNVFYAVDGYQAIKIYNLKRDVIDLVILGMKMPGISGEETFKELQKLDDQVKVIFASGYIPDDSARELFHSGCLAFLQKPYDMEILASVLRDVIP